MRILVTGATGVLGGMVAGELLTLGAGEVRALAGDPSLARLPEGVDVVPGFLGRPESLTKAYTGIDVVLFVPPHLPSLAEACRAAAEAGVTRIVCVAGPKGAAETSGLPVTQLEPAELMVESVLWARQIRAGDVVRDTSGDAIAAPIAREDIAAVAARVLIETGHEGRAYELTGPSALSRWRRVELIGEALGRRLRYESLPRHEAIDELRTDLGDHAACYVAAQELLVAHPQRPTPTVTALTGRPGTSFVDWTRQNAGLFT